MADERQSDSGRFLADPGTVRRGDTWFSRDHPPDVPRPPKQSPLERATNWLEERGLSVEVLPLGEDYMVDLVRHSDGRRLISTANGRTPEEAVEAAVHWWKRRFSSG